MPRPRLRAAVTQHDPTMVLVSAPAGFGKSTMLAEFVEFTLDQTPGTRVAWVGLDVADNDPVRFASYLDAALRTPERDVSAPLDAVVIRTLNALADTGDEVLLVLDDYHVIQSAEIHSAIELMVDRAPASFRLVLAGRVDPALPLARWRARGDLIEIRAADLRFTDDETTRYLNDTMGLALSDADVAALGERTEGWIAALQLAALSVQGRADPADRSTFVDRFTGNDRFVVDFLVEEVVDRQTEEVRAFLLRTSILDRLHGDLCDAVTSSSGGRSMLVRLERANMFVSPLDDAREWYRYHHLFAEVLRSRLEHEQPDEASHLHLRASRWFEERGDARTAIEHAIAGGHHDQAARLIELSFATVRAERHDATLRRWLESLPDSIFENRPVLAVALVGARMATGDTTGVASLLDHVEAHLPLADLGDLGDPGRATGPAAAGAIVFDVAEAAGLPAQVAVYRAALGLREGDIASTVHHATRVLELADRDDHLRRGAASALLGLAAWTLGHLSEAEDRYVGAVATFVRAGFVPDALGCSIALADIRLARGDLAGAEATYRAALGLAADQPGLRGTADMHVGLAEIHLERGDLGAAVTECHASERLGEAAGLPQHPYRSKVAEARLHQARGAFADALELLDAASRVHDTDFSPAIEPVEAMRTRVQLAAGHLDAARHWAASRGLDPADPISYVSGFEQITLARLLVTDPDTRTAPGTLDLVDRLVDAARAGRRGRQTIELASLRALIDEANGDRVAATSRLEEALLLAAPDGYVRVFLESGPSLLALLREASLGSDARRHADRVIAAAADGGGDGDGDGELTPAVSMTTAAPPLTLVDGLSHRELDVLRLLRSELTGPEIARELHVSLNTLRTHTKHIYTKLGATNRREAVRLAADHGL